MQLFPSLCVNQIYERNFIQNTHLPLIIESVTKYLSYFIQNPKSIQVIHRISTIDITQGIELNNNNYYRTLKQFNSLVT